MAMVRNSVGANAYVADEIITARSGMRLRVGNTDAEVWNSLWNYKIKTRNPIQFTSLLF